MLLITGASGNVGGAMAEKAVRNGIDFVGTSFKNEVKGLFQIDLALRNDVEALFEAKRFETVIHCASVISNSIDAYASNVMQSANISACGRESFIVDISTGGMYKNKGNHMLTEDSEIECVNSYWLSKKHGEEIFRLTFQDDKLLILRISAPYSPARESSSIVYTMINKAFSDGKIEYWGSGLRTQTFTNVETLAADILKMLDKNLCGTYNYATSKTFSMRELADIVAATFSKFGRHVEVSAAGRDDPEDACRCSIGTSKIRGHIDIYDSFAEDIEKIVRTKLCL